MIYYSFTKYDNLRRNPPEEVIIVTNVDLLLDNWLQKKNTWLYICIASSIAFVIIFLVVLVLRKRISIAIALVKEGSRAVSSITSTVFFPIFPWIFQVAVIVFAIVVGLYLASVGETVNQIVRMDASCLCSGPAAGYKVGAESFLYLAHTLARLLEPLSERRNLRSKNLQ